MKYVKKPVEIEAVQWTGENTEEILDFTNHTAKAAGKLIEIPTLEGTMKASPNDYIIKGIHGEFYPCKPYVFRETYEKYDDGIDVSVKSQYINQPRAKEKRIISCKKIKKAVIVCDEGKTRLYINNKEITDIFELYFSHDASNENDPKLTYTAMVENML